MKSDQNQRVSHFETSHDKTSLPHRPIALMGALLKPVIALVAMLPLLSGPVQAGLAAFIGAWLLLVLLAAVQIERRRHERAEKQAQRDMEMLALQSSGSPRLEISTKGSGKKRRPRMSDILGKGARRFASPE